MKKKVAFVIALLGWFALFAQLILMLENRVTNIPETVIRFFSFFTILTNTMVAFYFTIIFLNKKLIGNKPGFLTALTIYITIVGAVYQLVLRSTWQPEGLQILVDELLHSVIPISVLLFWASYETIKTVNYSQIGTWMLYPLGYLIFVLIRGHLSNFYPYPFIDVNKIGIKEVLINSGILTMFFLFTSFLLLFIAKKIIKNKLPNL